MSLRNEVIKLYRQILRIGRKWEALDPQETPTEQHYILTEAQRLFKLNKYILNENDIRQHLEEGKTRVELALHYNIPYPRPVHFPQHVVSTKTAKMKGNRRIMRQSRPIYQKSYDKDDG